MARQTRCLYASDMSKSNTKKHTSGIAAQSLCLKHMFCRKKKPSQHPLAHMPQGTENSTIVHVNVNGTQFLLSFRNIALMLIRSAISVTANNPLNRQCISDQLRFETKSRTEEIYKIIWEVEAQLVMQSVMQTCENNLRTGMQNSNESQIDMQLGK